MVEFFRRFELDEPAHARIAARARAHRLAVLATPLSTAAVAMLERVGVDGYKIASGDITWEGLIRSAAATGKPLVISTGMATLAEAQRALVWAMRGGAPAVALLHCVSAYPVPKGQREPARDCHAGHGLPARWSGCRTMAPMRSRRRWPWRWARRSTSAIWCCRPTTTRSTPTCRARRENSPPSFAPRPALPTALGTGAVACLPAERANLEASRRALYARRRAAGGTRRRRPTT